MAETYAEMSRRHRKEMDAFPCFWAYSAEQFEEGMRKLGLDPGKKSDKDKIVPGIVGGMFLESENRTRLAVMLARHKKELSAAIAADKKGDRNGFTFEMFRHELANHEYPYTRDPEETLDALGISWESLEASPAMQKALELAEKAVVKDAV